MSWRERDYTWFPERDRGAWRDWRAYLPPPLSFTLVIVHIVGFLILLMFSHDVAPDAASALTLTPHAPAWTVLTHILASLSSFKVGLVAIALWVLAARIEEHLGWRRLLATYLAGNLFAGLGFVAIAGFLPEKASAPLDIPLGALAAMTVVLTRTLPYESASVFGRFVALWKVALSVAGVYALLTMLAYQDGALAWLVAGLCGAAVAPVIETFALIRTRRAAAGEPGERNAAPTPKPARQRVAPRDEPHLQNDAELDEILAKISRSGISSLTESERNALERLRKSRLERDQEASRVR